MKTKTIVSLSVGFFLFNTLYALDTDVKRKAADLIAQKESKIRSYHLSTGLTDAITLPMPYGESEIISETDRKKIKESTIVRVDLVFSDFPKGEDLKKLNLKRIQQLEKIRASLVSDWEIPWQIIRQTSCKNEAEAKTLFHGIVIHIRSKQDPETVKKDLSSLSMYLSNDTLTKKVPLPDSTIFKVLKRNEKWKNMLVVSDLTGSMAPYTAQLILWFKLNASDNKVRDIVFFNDGDRKLESEKELGKTGGIYHTKAKDYEAIVELAEKTMKAGGGGDCPENDIEAILKGIELSPDASEIVLIADNFAPVKDIALLSKVKKPVRIILCGTRFGINTQYLEIAFKTGGSIHTMEEDLLELMKLKEGEKFTFDKRTFQLLKGNFVEIKKI